MAGIQLNADRPDFEIFYFKRSSMDLLSFRREIRREMRLWLRLLVFSSHLEQRNAAVAVFERLESFGGMC
jgi:hypothetical protein